MKWIFLRVKADLYSQRLSLKIYFLWLDWSKVLLIVISLISSDRDCRFALTYIFKIKWEKISTKKKKTYQRKCICHLVWPFNLSYLNFPYDANSWLRITLATQKSPIYNEIFAIHPSSTWIISGNGILFHFKKEVDYLTYNMIIFITGGGYQILVQKVLERDLSCDGICKKLKF